MRQSGGAVFAQPFDAGRSVVRRAGGAAPGAANADRRIAPFDFCKSGLYPRSCAGVAELVDAPDLGSGAARCGSSSLPTRTTALPQGSAKLSRHRRASASSAGRSREPFAVALFVSRQFASRTPPTGRAGRPARSRACWVEEFELSPPQRFREEARSFHTGRSRFQPGAAIRAIAVRSSAARSRRSDGVRNAPSSTFRPADESTR